MLMALTDEDSLRLHVLLANKPKAIRIDESKMIVYGLLERGEATVMLHPNCRDEMYLKQVRELIAEQVIPGGSYPLRLQRWGRMGQARAENLQQLLLLGLPQAIEAVVNSPSLTAQLASLAWWAMPSSDHARSMLQQTAVINSEIGKILAQHLLEYLPFETEAVDIMQTIALVLQAELIDESSKMQLWHKAQNKNMYYVGFLTTLARNLPGEAKARSDFFELKTKLQSQNHNELARQLIWISSADGQNFLITVTKVLKKPTNQDVVNKLFDSITQNFAALRDEYYPNPDMNLDILIQQAKLHIQNNNAKVILQQLPQATEQLQAILLLAGLSYAVLRPIFANSTAIGTLMRKKISPIINVIEQNIILLQRNLI
jgi:hypothetical protein